MTANTPTPAGETALLALADAFLALTREQAALLLAPEPDAEALSASLARRADVLAGLQSAWQTPQAAPCRPALRARLTEAQALDRDNMARLEAGMTALQAQARQAARSRQGIAGYGRQSLAGESPALWDTRQ